MCGWGAGERVVPGLGVARGDTSWGTDGEGWGQGNALAGPECPCGTGCGGGWGVEGEFHSDSHRSSLGGGCRGLV